MSDGGCGCWAGGRFTERLLAWLSGFIGSGARLRNRRRPADGLGLGRSAPRGRRTMFAEAPASFVGDVAPTCGCRSMPRRKGWARMPSVGPTRPTDHVCRSPSIARRGRGPDLRVPVDVSEKGWGADAVGRPHAADGPCLPKPLHRPSGTWPRPTGAGRCFGAMIGLGCRRSAPRGRRTMFAEAPHPPSGTWPRPTGAGRCPGERVGPDAVGRPRAADGPCSPNPHIPNLAASPTRICQKTTL